MVCYKLNEIFFSFYFFFTDNFFFFSSIFFFFYFFLLLFFFLSIRTTLSNIRIDGANGTTNSSNSTTTATPSFVADGGLSMKIQHYNANHSFWQPMFEDISYNLNIVIPLIGKNSFFFFLKKI